MVYTVYTNFKIYGMKKLNYWLLFMYCSIFLNCSCNHKHHVKTDVVNKKIKQHTEIKLKVIFIKNKK